MKKRVFITLLFAMTLHLFAQEAVFAPDGWSFNIVSDFVYFPKTDYVAGNTHFAPVTGVFDNFQNRERFHSVYLKHTPMGTNPLFQYANLSVDLGLELTVINIAPMVSISFMPLPFLFVNAGGSFGAGWPIFGIDSISVLEKSTGEWKGLKSFVNNYYDIWAAANFQFDTGAVIPGEWNHVIMTASCKIIYIGMTGLKNGEIWSWQGEPNMTSGFQYYQSYMMGYHFPKYVEFLGLISNVYGYIDSNAFGSAFASYDADFTKVDLDTVIEFKFGKEVLDFLLDFSSRRSFSEPHKSMKEEVFLTTTGREWYFRGFIISWKHKF